MLTWDLESKDGCEDDEDPKDNWSIMMKFVWSKCVSVPWTIVKIGVES